MTTHHPRPRPTVVTCDTWPVGEEWPFVGREDEIRQVREAMDGHDLNGTVLAGWPGVGKTRLAVECLAAARQADWETARATASRSAAEIPFGALASLLSHADGATAGAVDDRADLLRRATRGLVDHLAGRRMLLLVDDAHLLDDASATLVHQLATTGSVFVLATVRSGEVAPDPIVALWKDGLAPRVEVAGLDNAAVATVLEAALGGPVDRGGVNRLTVRCQGNLLFLRELVISARDRGALRDEGGLWRLVGRFGPSDRLVELVEGRLQGLDQSERELLEIVAVGEPLGSSELAALGDLGLAEDLERRGLLRSDLDGRRLSIRLAHPLYGEVLRSRLPALSSREIARRLAEALAATGARRREDLLRLATWRLEAGSAEPELLGAAASAARWRYDFPLAERLARAALEAGAGFDVALLAAQLASLQGRGDDAESELGRLFEQATDDRERGLAAVARLDNCVIYAGSIDEGLHLTEVAEARITDPAWRDEITARRAALILAAEGPASAAALAEPLVARAEGRSLVWACMPASQSLTRLGRLDAAIDCARRGRSVQLSLPGSMDWYPCTHLFYEGEALLHGGHLGAAESLARAQYDEGVASGSVEAQALFAGLLTRVLIERGRPMSAIGFGREATALYRQLERPQFEQTFLLYLAMALALAGQVLEATEALQAHDQMPLSSTFFMGVDPQLVRAWIAASGGDLPAATVLLEEAVAGGTRIGDHVGVLAALHDLARLGRPEVGAARLAEAAGRVEGVLSAARVAHVEGLVARDPLLLLDASLRFEEIGADLVAAECAADAAVLLRQAGSSREATAATRRSAVILDRCEGARSPAVHDGVLRSVLTPAEREAALLAANGRSNKAIADELCISVRTVENRLMHVYEKLGVSGRTELATALSG